MANKEEGILDIIIETPKGCRNKYTWDENQKAFCLKKVLPVGAVFPFDFGFIPHTKGEDGDPLDVLVIMDEPAFPGCILPIRLIGALKAKQTERDGRIEQNDRFIGVCIFSELYKDIYNINDLNKALLTQIEEFFISYNQLASKKFEPQGWSDASEALSRIKQGAK